MKIKGAAKEFFLKVFILIFVGVITLFTACKTKPIPVKEETAYIQLTDKAQISFKGLPCQVYLSDGTMQSLITNEDGKVTVKADSNILITKIVYDFNNYKRPKGKLLAKEEFSIVKKVKSKAKSLIQTFELNLAPAAGLQIIVILDVFNI